MADPVAIICIAPDECRPCSIGRHDECSLDGEPECLCEKCTLAHKEANLASLSRRPSDPITTIQRPF